MQIHELPNGNINDSNQLPFDTGTNSYSTTFGAIAEYITTKTFSGFTTTVKNIIGAVNELKTAIDTINLKMSATVTSGSYGMTSARFYRRGKIVLLQFGGTPSDLTTGWKQAVQIPDGFIPAETRTPYATCVPQNGGFQPFLVTCTHAGYVEINPTMTTVTGFINALYMYYID